MDLMGTSNGRELPNRRMIRVLHFIPTGHIGGIETFVYELARTVDRTRIQITVCSLSGEGPMLERIRDAGIEAFSIDFNDGIVGSAVAYCSQLRRRRFDIIHANVGGRKLKRIARFFGCLVVSHCHGYEFGQPIDARRSPETSVVARQLTNSYGSASDWLVFCCSWLQDRFQEYGTALLTRSSIIHYGVDANRYHDVPEETRRALRAEWGVPQNRPVIGFVGRFTDQKGLPFLFAAAKWLIAAYPGVHFLLVGDGPLRSYVEAGIRTLGRENFTLAGARLDAERCLPIMDAVVVPSEWEGLPIVVLEAMASERPVVAFDVGGISEAIVPGETGTLVPYGDVDRLAIDLLALLRDPAHRRQMGAAARRHVQNHFSVEASTGKITRLYEQLVDEVNEVKLPIP